MTLTFGSLFAGIGGIDLGLERAGMQCAWQVEIDDYATRVLTKHWPDVPKFRDVRECSARNLSAVDCIAGGFPCQDISKAGRGSGLAGKRSGLWFEFWRLIRELRPRYVVVENVSALLTRGMGTVLGNLAEIGYDAEWQCIPAASFGAPHLRERIFIVAYPHRINGNRRAVFDGAIYKAFTKKSEGWLSDGRSVGITDGQGIRRVRRIPDSRICGVAHGLPARMDRLRGLGNAVVPQIDEFVGQCIVRHAND